MQLYQPYLNLPAGRGIGHGAVPRFVDEGGRYQILHPQVPLLEEVQLGRRTEGFYDRGYVILSLEGGEASVTYYTIPAGVTSNEAVAQLELFSEKL